MRNLLFSIGGALVLVLGLLVYNNSTSFAGKLYPLEKHRIELKQTDAAGEQILMITIDEHGHFYKEVKSGPGVGNFELWDGKRFYRFDNEYKDLMIVKTQKKERLLHILF
ncbi:hypothetical protein ACI2OX_09800 [Bacillus sp. N9]